MTVATIRLEHGEPELAAGARSYIYRMLASAFSYPSGESAETLADGAWIQQARTLALHLPFEVEALHGDWPAEDAALLRQWYVSTFEVGAGGPYCALYEGAHRNGKMKLMEDVVRFYEHFGLRPEAGDQPDHLCAELEFMHYLAFKEAAALAHGEGAGDLRRAQHDFLDRHLCRWMPRLRQRLEGSRNPPSLYLSVSRLGEEFCKRDRAWLRQEWGKASPRGAGEAD